MSGVLVANRGEIAVRIMRAARELGLRTVAVYPRDDQESLHVHRADEVYELPGAGVAAYLNGAGLVEAAAATGCTAVHPGYGFLAEDAEFARRCAERGLTFIGPAPEVLELFGDKTEARRLAERVGVPVVPGTSGPATLEQARAFTAAHAPVILKAIIGGGGRGMRVVHQVGELDDAYAECMSEGGGGVYLERLVGSARHVEVQVAGDGSGEVRHLGDRDCSIQRRHQKLVEIAPSPALSTGVRKRLLEAALALAAEVRYRTVGTVEFLVRGEEFWFIEVNPRLQVEHTVTEEVTGVDLVHAQIRLAFGASLPEVGLAESPRPRGCALQARVNAETLDADGTPRPGAGTLTAFVPPSGPGVRVDTYGYPGYRTSPRYDPLLAKVIVSAGDLPSALTRAYAALCEFQVAGVPTNIALLQSMLTHPDVVAGRASTAFLADHLPELIASAEEHPRRYPEDVHQASPARREPAAPEGALSVVSPMQAVIAGVEVDEGDRVAVGARLAVLEAMKMEHVVRAERAGLVLSVLAEKGELVEEGAPLLFLAPTAGAEEHAESDLGTESPEEGWAVDEGWAAEVAEIQRRRELAVAMGGPDKVARHRAAGRLTVRERIDQLVDPGSFREIGALTGFASYGEDGALCSVLPANFVAGTARIDGRKVMLGADDFTVRGGSGDAAIHVKQVFSEQYAGQMRLPLVRLLDGQSGGGSVKMAQQAGFTYVPVNPGWDAVVDNLSVVPVVAAGLGPTVGLGAARLVMSHLAVLVSGVGQLFTAGPPVVRAATGEDLDKEQLGGVRVHRRSGAVERFAETEREAFEIIRAFLSYLPDSVYQTPPVLASEDPAERPVESLLRAVPRNRRAPYRIDPILHEIFDTGSVFRYTEYGDATVTALARLDGHPVGVLATDPFQGATMSAVGALAITRLVELCETFHLPIVSLTDQAGMTIGSVAERRGTIRHGARAIAAIYQARVPQAELILRRVYGVGGAGIVNRHRGSRSWAWPSGDWGSLPVQGGVEAAFRAQLDGAEDREREIERLRRELEAVSSPFRTAERFGVQDLIDPRDSRVLLCEWVHDAYRLLPELTGRPCFGTRP